MIASLPPRPLPQYETHLASSHRHACHAYRTCCRICYIRYLCHGRIVLHRNTSLARLVATLMPGSPHLVVTDHGNGCIECEAPASCSMRSFPTTLSRPVLLTHDKAGPDSDRPPRSDFHAHAKTRPLTQGSPSHASTPRAHRTPLTLSAHARQLPPATTATATANRNCHENKTLDEAPQRMPLRSLSLGDRQQIGTGPRVTAVSVGVRDLRQGQDSGGWGGDLGGVGWVAHRGRA